MEGNLYMLGFRNRNSYGSMDNNMDDNMANSYYHNSIDDANGNRQRYFSGFFKIVAFIVILLVINLVFSIYQLSVFSIKYINQQYPDSIDWFNVHNPLGWIISVFAILFVLGVIRVVTTFIGSTVKFIFRIAQSDIITIILAVVVNGLLLVLNGWITYHIIQFITATGIDNFYNKDNTFSVIVMFCMLAAALIWVPRIGLYGENRLGQFDDNNTIHY